MNDILMYFIMFVVPFFIIGGFIKLVKLNKPYQPAIKDCSDDSLFNTNENIDTISDPSFSCLSHNLYNK